MPYARAGNLLTSLSYGFVRVIYISTEHTRDYDREFVDHVRSKLKENNENSTDEYT